MTTFQIVTLSVQVRACHKKSMAKTETALPRRRKARCPTRRRPTMLRLLLALALAAPAAGQEPKATATPVCATSTVSSPSTDTGCNYGACKSLTSGNLMCAYDSSFCGSTEEWLTAAEVIDAGEECTCMNILNYPMNIGTCSSSGVYSPMALASDCSGGTAVCDPDSDGHYMMGDTQSGAKQFTACDLPCSNSNDHTMDVSTDTYTGCEFYQTKWATIARATTGVMYTRCVAAMGNSVLVGGQIKTSKENTGARPCVKKKINVSRLEGLSNPRAHESTKMR